MFRTGRIMNRKIIDTASKCDAVIFDFDGTLVDSMWMWKQIDIEYLARFGISLGEEGAKRLQKDIEGMSFTETAVYFKDSFHIPYDTERIKADWENMSVEKYRREVKLKPYARDFLNFLKEKGKKLGIATSNGREMVDACMNSLGISSYFDRVAIACEVSRGKPFPDIYLLVSEELSASPESCLVFEDVPAGIIAGKRAGMKVCAVEDDFSAGMREEKKSLADFYIRDYSEIIPS
jgi:HAD superfamily hydrolase (TIGR01509 family)